MGVMAGYRPDWFARVCNIGTTYNLMALSCWERLYPYSDSQLLVACKLADFKGLVLSIFSLLLHRYCTRPMRVHGVPVRSDPSTSTFPGAEVYTHAKIIGTRRLVRCADNFVLVPGGSPDRTVDKTCLSTVVRGGNRNALPRVTIQRKLQLERFPNGVEHAADNSKM